MLHKKSKAIPFGDAIKAQKCLPKCVLSSLKSLKPLALNISCAKNAITEFP